MTSTTSYILKFFEAKFCWLRLWFHYFVACLYFDFFYDIQYTYFNYEQWTIPL